MVKGSFAAFADDLDFADGASGIFAAGVFLAAADVEDCSRAGFDGDCAFAPDVMSMDAAKQIVHTVENIARLIFRIEFAP